MKPITTTNGRTINLVTLCAMSLVVGAVTGLGAVGLRALIGVIHNMFFEGRYSWIYDANLFTPASPWGPLIILAPVIGGLVVVYMVKRFAPEARGHGVPEVMDAIFYKNGNIRPIVVVVKSLASAISIGTGSSVGREGPIIQIGSGIGSVFGQVWKLASWQRITLVAAGAGAGIAATFNTPLGAVMFAVELMLPELSARTFLPVVLATGTATYVGRSFFGLNPAFSVPVESLPDFVMASRVQLLPIYLVLGLLCGVASAAFVRFLYWLEDKFDEMPGNDYTRNIVGMLGIGILMYVLLLTFGQYYTDGVGYATIQSVLTGELNVAWMLALLFFAKLLATSISLSAGASGGIFSPSLFLGATLGGFFGAVCAALFPDLGLSPIPFAIIGMAAIVGGSTGASMTAILMIFEMTRDYAVTVPAIIAVATAVGTRRVLSRENIYTMKLARRGHRIPKERHSHMFLIRHAENIMAPVVGTVPVGDIPAATGALSSLEPAKAFRVVMDGRRIAGVVAASADGSVAPGTPVIRNFTIVRNDDFLQAVVRRMSRKLHPVALVIKTKGVPRPEDVLGVVTRNEIAGTIMSDFVN